MRKFNSDKKNLATILKSIFSLEGYCSLWVVLFYLSGKWSITRMRPRFAGIEYFLHEPRYWFFFGLLSVVPIVLFLRRFRKVRSHPLLILMLTVFFCYSLLSIAWSYHHLDSTRDKAVELILLLAFLLTFYFIVLKMDMEKFLFCFWVILMPCLLIFAALAISSLVEIDSFRLGITALGGGGNSFGRYMGIMCLGSIYLWQKTEKTPIWIITFSIGLLLIFASGSRGAMIGFIGAIIIYLLLVRVNFRLIVFFLTILMASFILLNYSNIGKQAEKSFERRVTVVFEEDKENRLEIFKKAIDIWEDSPILGAGLGSFNVKTRHAYPHNMILEALSEGGLVGFFLLSAVFVISLVKLIRLRHFDKLTLAAMVLLLIGAQISGDLYSHRGVFIFLLIIISHSEFEAGKRDGIVRSLERPTVFSRKKEFKGG